MTSHTLSCCGAALLTAAALVTSAAAQASNPKDADPKIELEDKDAVDSGKVELSPDPGQKTESLPGAGRAPAGTPAPAALPDIPGLEKLPKDQYAIVARNIADVSVFMRGVRLQESLEKLNESEAITGDFHLISNLRGAIFTKMKDYKSARAEFEKAIALTKDQPGPNFHPRFNLAEINFVEKQWTVAREQFSTLLASGQVPDNGTRGLMEYKVMICLLQEKKMDEAIKQIGKFDQYDNNSPAYYFGHAALSFANDKKEEAEEWLASAAKIYPKEINDVYQDSLVEVGWLQTLQ